MDVLANINLSIAVAMTLLSVSTVGGACAAVARFRRAKEEMRLSKEFFQSTFDSAAVGMACHRASLITFIPSHRDVMARPFQ